MRTEFYPRVRGGKQLKVEGYNQSRLLGELMKEHVCVYEIERSSAKEMAFKILNKDAQKTFAILDKLCYNYTVVRTLGLRRAALSRLNRLGLCFGLAAVVALYALSYGFIWRIEISGNTKVDSLTLYKALEESGCKRGSAKSSLDEKAIESALRRVEGIAEASCEKRGTTLKISVMESLDYVPRPSGGETEIVSLYDAEITRCVVRSGTAKVKVGQRVQKGAVLVSGEITGTDGQVIAAVRPIGEIYGKVVFSESVTVAKESVRMTKTGNTKKSTVLALFGLKIGKVFSGYDYSESVFATRRLSPLPIAVTSVITSELSAETVTFTEEEAQAEAERLLREKLTERLTGRPIAEELTIKDAGGGVICAVLYVTVEMKIGEL